MIYVPLWAHVGKVEKALSSLPWSIVACEMIGHMIEAEMAFDEIAALAIGETAPWDPRPLHPESLWSEQEDILIPLLSQVLDLIACW